MKIFDDDDESLGHSINTTEVPPFKSGQNAVIERGTSRAEGGNYPGADWSGGADSVARNLNKSIFFSLKAPSFSLTVTVNIIPAHSTMRRATLHSFSTLKR